MRLKKRIGTALIAVVFLPTPTTAAAFKQIETEAEFIEMLTGEQEWVNKYGAIVKIHANHVLTGQIGRQIFGGKWSWEGKFLCRTLWFADRYLENGCVIVKFSGSQFIEIRDKGRSDTIVYSKKGHYQ